MARGAGRLTSLRPATNTDKAPPRTNSSPAETPNGWQAADTARCPRLSCITRRTKAVPE